MTVLKKELVTKSSCSKEIAAPRKHGNIITHYISMEKVTVVSLLCITLKKCEEVAFPKIKLS